jgi:hypothetical protein
MTDQKLVWHFPAVEIIESERSRVRGASRNELPGLGGDQKRMPLWLSLSEAQALAELAGASPACAGPVEEELFSRLGKFLQTFYPVAHDRRSPQSKDEPVRSGSSSAGHSPRETVLGRAVRALRLGRTA